MTNARSTLLWLSCAMLLIIAAAITPAAGPSARLAWGTPPVQAATITTTSAAPVFLPFVNRGYLTPYINPFGAVMYGRVAADMGLSQMQAAGAKRVTVLLDWSAVEPTEGARNWAAFDANVSNARAAGMEILVLFIGDPQWAWTPAADGTDLQKRVNFVRSMVDRYDCDGVNDAGPNMCVREWSFYAEPDADYGPTVTPGAKGWWGKRPQQYAQMLASVAPVVHQEDIEAKVMNGGLAYDGFIGEVPNGLFRRDFFPKMLQTLNASYGGAAQHLDLVAVHYYPLMFASVRDKVTEIKTIMAQNGVGQKPVVIPEAGYWSDTSMGSTEAKQAATLVRFYVDALAMEVRSVAWFNIFDSATGSPKWGLFRGQDLSSPKPAYYAYTTITRELTGARFLRNFEQSGVQGGVFLTPSRREKSVVWSTGASGQATFNGSCLREVTTQGTVYAPIGDGQAGWDLDNQVNGRITLRVTDQPIYVEACP